MELRDSRVYYGICSTDEDQPIKDVVIMNPILVDNNLDLAIGDELIVKFEKGNINPEPTLNLNISDNNNNVTVSANSGYRVLIDEICDWGAQTIVSFVYVYGAPVAAVVTEEEVNSEIVTTVTEIGAESMYWKPIDYKIASEDTYGVTKLVTDINELNNNDDRPVSYNIIQSLLSGSNNSLGLELTLDENYDNIDGENYGTLSLVNNGNKNVIFPKPVTNTSQLINDGDGNGIYWSSHSNNYVDSPSYGIGYQYTGTDQQKHTIRSFVPYGTITSNGVTSNAIRIGRDALEAYQRGTEDSSNQLIEKNPYLRLYGNKIDLMIDAGGQVRVGDVDIPGGTYNPRYIFEADKATFNKPLIANKLTTSSIVYNGTELENRLPYYYIKTYHTSELTLLANSAVAKKGNDDNRTLNITSIPAGYTPIAIAGYNINGGGEVHYVNMWECYIKDNVIHYGIYNFSDSKITLTGVYFDVLFVKTGLIKP